MHILKTLFNLSKENLSKLSWPRVGKIIAPDQELTVTQFNFTSHTPAWLLPDLLNQEIAGVEPEKLKQA